MSVSINRNNMTQLDGFYAGEIREKTTPVLKHLADDLLANGFEDVGPTITKLTLNNKQLTKYIDEFIVYHYDSNCITPSEGAFGIGDPINATPVRAFGSGSVDYLLDGIGSQRVKKIDDVYLYDDWHLHLSEELQQGMTYTGALDLETALGPNCELFSYLNPHPNMRGGEARWHTSLQDNAGDGTAQTVIHMVSTELLQEGDILFEIAGVPTVSPFPTITAINSSTSITMDQAVTSTRGDELIFGKDQALYAAGSTSLRPVDLYNGHFYKKRPSAVPLLSTAGAAKQPGYVGLPGISEKIYYNEFNKIKRLITTAARGVTFMPAASTGVNTEAKLRHYKEEKAADGTVKHHFWISNYKDDFFFPAGTVEPSKYQGDLMLGFDSAFTTNVFQIGDIYTFTFTHKGIAPAPDVIYEIPVIVGLDPTIKGFTQSLHEEMQKSPLADPKGGVFSAIIDPDRIGVIEFTSRDMGHSLTASVSRTARPNQSYTNSVVNFIVPQTQASSTVTDGVTTSTGATYTNGYIHEVQIRGLEGSNIGDEFQITLEGVVDEDAADVTLTTAVKDVVIDFTTNVSLNASQLAEAMANKIRANAYVSKYMKVEAGANFITIKYDRASSAYMKKSIVGATHGLLGVDSATLTGTIGATSSSEYSLDGFLVADLPTHAAFTANVTNFYTADVLHSVASTGVEDGLDFELAETQAGVNSAVSTVRLGFPLARDLGTFANPPTGNWTAYSNFKLPGKGAGGSGLTNYFVSYEMQVLSNENRPLGPQVSFDTNSLLSHPNTQYGGSSSGEVSWTEFDRFTKEIEIESFEYIEDYSMGPIVLESSSTSQLSGSNGDQPWRLRLDVSRGQEVRETSPYINPKVLETNQDPRSVYATTGYEYLSVHVATKFQLQSDGDISEIQGRDGIRKGDMREPGFLGALRPQFNGYLETITHLVNPYVNRLELEDNIQSGFNIYGGLVGSQHYTSAYALKTIGPGATGTYNFSEAFSLPAGTTAPTLPSGTSITKGVLSDDEYRFEEKLLKGTSTEMLNDTPYNSGSLRIQKGLFRRTGKFGPEISGQYPMSYTLTVADHGISFYIKDQASHAQADDNAFFLVQRHVDATTGQPDFTSEHQPLHCVYQSSLPPVLYSDLTPYFTEKQRVRANSLAYQGIYDASGNYTYEFRIDELKDEELQALEMDTQGRFRRFVVREKDTLKPWDRHVFAGINERDSHAVLNPLEQLTLNDQGQLVIQFPNRLGSQRFLYTGTELDLIAFCGAGAVGQDTLITSDRFSTTGTNDKRRLYKGQMSTEAFGNGMRILQLVAGHGIATTDVDTSLLSS